MARTVRTHFLDGPTVVDSTLEVNDIVVAYAAETALTVETVNLFDRDVAPCGCRGAVYNDFINFSHVGNIFVTAKIKS